FYRTTVGYDRLFDLLANVSKADTGGGYPPYNIERLDENDYRITLAVAGFGDSDIEIVSHEQSLIVKGVRTEGDDRRTFLHQGIAGRSFERRFELADYVKVSGATLVNGLLNIDLKREVPEAKKPRKIEINATSSPSIQIVKGEQAA
ncbi:MAG: Hsp20 family protein, partial [Parvularculaceae bacterium]|nr:Hsp20 family protein [Parvularculaceae bacterium]